jgi:hypothetical protein
VALALLAVVAAALWAPACAVRGTVDNVPNQPAVEVTRIAPEGPTATRESCPANPPAICGKHETYVCERDPRTNCDLCDCMR